MAKRFSLEGISVLGNSQIAAANSSLEDINHLLFLETLQRFKENETNLRQQAEEKARLYEEARKEYRHYFERYVQLYKFGVTRVTLDNDVKISENQLDQLKADLFAINQNVRNDESIGYLTPETVEQCQQAISAPQTYDEVSNIEEETKKIKVAVDAIQSLNSKIEQKLESVITRSVEFYIEKLQSENT